MSNSLITEAYMRDALRRLHKINNHLSSVASEIEELGCNLETGDISEKLKFFAGISIWKLRDICDFMHRLETSEHKNAQKFEDFLNGKLTQEEMQLPVDYQI